MEQNRPTNPFTSGVSTAAPDSFQAAIDYLLKGRQQTAATQRQGLFTQPAPVATPTTSVVKDVFGDQYRRGSSDSGGSDRPFTGNPYTGSSPFGPTTAEDVARWSSLEGSMRDNKGALTFGGMLLGATPLGAFGGLLGKYAPDIVNYFGERSYDNYLADQDARAAKVAETQAALGDQVGTYSDRDGSIGGTVSTQDRIDAYDRATFGITSAEMDAQRAGANSDLSTGPGDRSGRSSGGGRGVDGASNDAGYSVDNSKAGPGSTYGGEGE